MQLHIVRSPPLLVHSVNKKHTCSDNTALLLVDAELQMELWAMDTCSRSSVLGSFHFQNDIVFIFLDY